MTAEELAVAVDVAGGSVTLWDTPHAATITPEQVSWAVDRAYTNNGRNIQNHAEFTLSRTTLVLSHRNRDQFDFGRAVIDFTYQCRLVQAQF